MGISEFTTRVIGDKKHYRAYQARIEKLPPSYRTAVAGLERYYTYLGGMSDGGSILSMLDDLATLFEQSAADGIPIREIVGDDPVEFADEFVRNYPAGRWIIKERDRLTKAIETAEAEEAGTSSAP